MLSVAALCTQQTSKQAPVVKHHASLSRRFSHIRGKGIKRLQGGKLAGHTIGSAQSCCMQ
jgi:hypothetical protein